MYVSVCACVYFFAFQGDFKLTVSFDQFSWVAVVLTLVVWGCKIRTPDTTSSRVFCQPLDLWWCFGFTLIAQLGGLSVSIENFFFTIFFLGTKIKPTVKPASR